MKVNYKIRCNACVKMYGETRVVVLYVKIQKTSVNWISQLRGLIIIEEITFT